MPLSVAAAMDRAIATIPATVTATEQTAAVCEACALRPVAQPLRQGQTQTADLAVKSD
jgi:hypothetical protein